LCPCQNLWHRGCRKRDSPLIYRERTFVCSLCPWCSHRNCPQGKPGKSINIRPAQRYFFRNNQKLERSWRRGPSYYVLYCR
jgi:hypothetical protein